MQASRGRMVLAMRESGKECPKGRARPSTRITVFMDNLCGQSVEKVDRPGLDRVFGPND